MTQEPEKPLTFKPRADIRTWLEKEAAANHRSMSGQINFFLEQAKTAAESENQPA